jgi:hypothetical protein
MTSAVMEAPNEVATLDENAGIPPFLLDLMGRIDMEPTFKSERGLLYSFRPEQRNPDRYGGAEKTIQYEVLIKPETVTLRVITETCGVNPHSQKIYRSWKTDRILNLSLRAEKYGHRVLRIYETITKTRKYNGSFTNATARYSEYFDLNVEDGISDYFALEQVQPEHSFTRKPTLQHVAYTFAGWAFYQMFRKLDPTNTAFVARSFASSAAYPVLQLFPNSVLNVKTIRECLPKNYSLHSELDVKKFITKAFGAEGVRKDMVKAVVSTTDIGSIFLAAQLKELFPLDWLRDVVKSPLEYVIYDPKVAYTERTTAGLIALLSSLTLPQRKRLLVEKLEQAKLSRRIGAAARREISAETLRGDVKDSIRMFSGLNPEQKEEYDTRIDYSSWEGLHETLIQVTNEIRSKENDDKFSRRFDLGETYMAKLNDTSYEVAGETYTICAPKNRYDLNQWGNEMHNCIASYHREVKSHETSVFGIYHNDALFANVEISTRGAIVQHMQKYNSRSPQEHFDALAEHIKAVDEKIKKKKEEGKRIAEAQKRRQQRQLAVA